MQRVAPEIKAIQEKYKKYSMRDPRKAEMNKEVPARVSYINKGSAARSVERRELRILVTARHGVLVVTFHDLPSTER